MESTIEFAAAHGEDSESEQSCGGDVWRYDDTVLNELESFLGKIDMNEEESAPEEDSAAAKLLKEVQDELVDARKEIETLTIENERMEKRVNAGPLGQDEEYLEAYEKAEAVAKANQRLYEELKDTWEETSAAALSLYKVPESEHQAKPNVPSKFGHLTLNSMALKVHLIGGESLELINESKEGHQHVSRLDLCHINEVGVLPDNDKSFKVKSANGSYIMLAHTAAEAKSWARSIEISIKVAKAKKAKGKSS
eukprot:TRINITY_DN51957_c0_g1_i3.p1 TRINITY_DN51957_c0_g1~~TRINITY_DN51957_c0_g1_i3.p1  ORF type:complete len:252 (+),score=67.97 TRINITY_DN51957_c0_g1_i3:200-955(+)